MRGDDSTNRPMMAEPCSQAISLGNFIFSNL